MSRLSRYSYVRFTHDVGNGIWYSAELGSPYIRCLDKPPKIVREHDKIITDAIKVYLLGRISDAKRAEVFLEYNPDGCLEGGHGVAYSYPKGICNTVIRRGYPREFRHECHVLVDSEHIGTRVMIAVTYDGRAWHRISNEDYAELYYIYNKKSNYK